jgi:hypothetical protein
MHAQTQAAHLQPKTAAARAGGHQRGNDSAQTGGIRVIADARGVLPGFSRPPPAVSLRVSAPAEQQQQQHQVSAFSPAHAPEQALPSVCWSSACQPCLHAS